MLVYTIENQLDGKKYVGQTRRTIEERWREHLHSAGQPSRHKMSPYLYAAMNKYGFENFTIREQDRAETQEDLDKRETFWITEFGTANRKHGYNISFGGASPVCNPETSAKLSASLKGKPAWNKGKPAGEEHLRNMRIAAEKRRGKPHPLTEEGRASLRESKLGENNPNYGNPESAVNVLKWHKEHPDVFRGDCNPMYRKDVSDHVILQLRSMGFSQQRIGKLVKCSQKTIGNRLRSYPEYV